MVVRSGFYRGFGGRIFLSGFRRPFLRLRTGHSFCRISLLIRCDVGIVDVEILPFERIDIFFKGFLGGKYMIFLHNIPPVIRQILLLAARILVRFVLIGTFKNGFAGVVLHGEEEVAVFARELLLKILQTCVAAARLLLKKSCIVIGGGIHVAVERVADNVVLHKALGVRVAALIDEIRNADSAEKERDGKNRQQKKRRDLRPELGLYLFHLESASIL